MKQARSPQMSGTISAWRFCSVLLYLPFYRKGTSLSRSKSRSAGGSSQQKALSWSEAIRQTARLWVFEVLDLSFLHKLMLFCHYREDWERDMMLGGWTWTPHNSWERRKKTENETLIQENDLEEATKESKTFEQFSSKADSNESKEW